MRQKHPRTVRKVKVLRSNNRMAWWHYHGLEGRTFFVLDRSRYDSVKVEYRKGVTGWIPLTVCEPNPHIRLERPSIGRQQSWDFGEI